MLILKDQGDLYDVIEVPILCKCGILKGRIPCGQIA